MRFASSSKGAALALLFACAACSTTAPQLPTDTTGVNRTKTLSLKDFPPEDAALSCGGITAEQTALRRQMADANAAIEGNRVQNQTAGYLGGLFLVPAVAMKTNETEKDLLAESQQRLDVLGKLAVVKACGG